MSNAFNTINRITTQIQNKRAVSNVKTRINFVWGVIGANRTGKTVEAIKQARFYKQANPNNKVIVYDPQDWFKKAGVVDVEILATDKKWAETLCKKDEQGKYKYGNSLVILDDYRQLHTSNQMDDGFVSLCGLRTKMNVDIMYITWTPTLVLVRLAGFTNRFSIFYTYSQIGGFAKEIPNFIPCQQASILINKYVREYDLKEKGRELYPDFPHIVVDGTNDDELQLMNIDKDKMMKLL